MIYAVLILLIILMGMVGFLWFRKEDLSAIEKCVRDENAQNRSDFNQSLNATRDSLNTQITLIGQGQQQQLDSFGEKIAKLSEVNQTKLDQIRETISLNLKGMNEENQKRLDEMRLLVDKKLQEMLQERLKESFGIVTKHLEGVQTALGEMRTVAASVGDLKKVLSNVKSRGVWGEYLLGNLLAEYLTPEQYVANFAPKKNNDFVEYAIKFPGKKQNDAPVYLPIDAKFPREDYERLITATENGDAPAVTIAQKALLSALEKAAKDIHNKYISPPVTTPFAVMFLPTEGLYSEILRDVAFGDKLRNLNVLPAGPTSLGALLNSLNVGFATLTIEKKAAEIGNILAGVKREFSQIDQGMNKARKHLENALGALDATNKVSAKLQKRLVDFDDSDTNIELEKSNPPLISE